VFEDYRHKKWSYAKYFNCYLFKNIYISKANKVLWVELHARAEVPALFQWRHNTQHKDTQHNDSQHNDTQHNDTQHNDTQHNDTQHNYTQHNSK
jgi:hypothetical protein